MEHVNGQKRLPDEQDREVHDLEALIAEISSDLISLHCEQIDAASGQGAMGDWWGVREAHQGKGNSGRIEFHHRPSG
jgi:hypothetical protein